MANKHEKKVGRSREGTCRDAGQGSSKEAGHQEGSPERSFSKLVDLAQQERVLQDQHNCFSIRAERQSQNEAICGMHRESQLLQLEAEHAQSTGTLALGNLEDLRELHNACKSYDAKSQSLQRFLWVSHTNI